jgi:hypothetical protein
VLDGADVPGVGVVLSQATAKRHDAMTIAVRRGWRRECHIARRLTVVSAKGYARLLEAGLDVRACTLIE